MRVAVVVVVVVLVSVGKGNIKGNNAGRAHSVVYGIIIVDR